MKTNLNQNPYYDDYNELKNFYKILFNPGLSVQARELTQMQSILNNQIAKFGDSIYQQGSVVIPGNAVSQLNVNCIKLAATSPFDSSVTNASLFQGATLVGAVSGVKAYVKLAVKTDGTNPDTLYLSYVSGGGANGATIFNSGEMVSIIGSSTVQATVASNAIGSLASVNNGVYYVNGTFVSVAAQTVVISAYNSTPSAHVVLLITESIVTADMDFTLLDPSQGSNNFAAPGADRLKITLTLQSIPLATTLNDNYIELMRYDTGVLLEYSRYPKYSELEKSLARRTYDESGDYVVNGFDVSVSEHYRTRNNGGVFIGGDPTKLVYDIAPGKAYINGFEIESLANTRFIVDKGRTAAHQQLEPVTMIPNYGQYLMCTSLLGTFDTNAHEQVSLYDISPTTGGTLIGTANILSLQWFDGDAVVAPIYKAFLYNINLTSGSIAKVGSIRTASGKAKVVSKSNIQVAAGTFNPGDVVNYSATVRTGTVAYYNPVESYIYIHKHSATDAPTVGDFITDATTGGTATLSDKTVLNSVGQSSMVFKLPIGSTATLKNASNLYDLTETVWQKLVMTSGTTTSSFVSSGTIVPLNVGTLIAINSSGVLDPALFSLNGGATAITKSVAAVSDIALYIQVNKIAVTPRVKTKTVITGETATAGLSVNLTRSDVISLDTLTVAGVDVSNRYRLVTGQTDYSYNLGSIVLKDGYTVPSGTLTIGYTYFSHGAGDFFTADSYSSIGTGYLDQVPVYTSPVDGTQYRLRDCVDYRSSSSSGLAPVVSSVLTTSVKRFIPRTDLIALDKTGAVKLITGTPSNNAASPPAPSDWHLIQNIYIPPYTDYITDVVSIRTATVRSTMKDISNITARIERLEDYTTLTALESKSVQQTVIDASTGLTKYKTGYLTEDMSNPLGNADYFNVQFAAAWTKGGMIASVESQSSPLGLNASSSIVSTLYNNADGTPAVVMTSDGTALHNNGVITLAYTEKIFATNPLSSKVTNVNPFSVIAWNGSIKLTPAGDTWTEQIDLPEIFNTSSYYNTITNYVMLPPDPVPTVVGPTPVSFGPSSAPRPPVAPVVPGPVVPVALTVGPGIAFSPGAGAPGAFVTKTDNQKFIDDHAVITNWVIPAVPERIGIMTW